VSRFGDGLAVGADLTAAAESAARQAVEPLAGAAPDLACVFVCSAEPAAAAAAGERACAVTGARKVIGCSAPGVIGGDRGVEASSAVAVWAGLLPGVSVRTFHLEVMRIDRGMAVVGLPERAPGDAVAVLLADPYSFPADGFVSQSNETLAGLPFVGGLATGFAGPGSSRLFLDGRTVTRGAVGAVLGGPVGARTAVSQGCRPVGPAMVVTAAEGSTILELAGQPALAKLEAVLAQLPPEDQALASGGLQIGIAMDEYAEEHEQGDFLVRGIAGADRPRGGLVVGDVVEVGRTVRFQVRDAATAEADLDRVLGRLRGGDSFDTVEGALLFSCTGRGRGLFPTADHDPMALRRAFGRVGVAGFFAAGEIGPVGRRNHVHGFTASMLLFGSGPVANRGTAADVMAD
jgi:small ligand-binding sensory domain FIST